MLNFAICDDNLNILDKMSKMLESIFTKNELDAKVSLASNNVDKVLDYIYCNKKKNKENNFLAIFFLVL